MACFIVPMSAAVITTAMMRKKITERLHIDWLVSMLWGGVIMLAVEHISHGEVTPYPPFLTRSIAEVLPEALRVGVPMTLAVVILWGVMVLVSNLLNKKAMVSKISA